MQATRSTSSLPTGGNGAQVTFDMKGVTIVVGCTTMRSCTSEASWPDCHRTCGPYWTSSRGHFLPVQAVIAHGERRQREADQEAENQRNGSYEPVLLDVRDGLQSSIKIRKQKKAPKLQPSWQPVARLKDAYGHDILK